MCRRFKVSVGMISYNQAEFIASALDSVLAQRASFEFEIVIGDDCSSDGTRDIIQKYQRLWPDRIKTLLHPQNIGMGRNFKQVLEACSSEYTALLEGDDYWTNPQKLQAQVEYLEAHADCALCHHRVEHLNWPDGRKIREFPPSRYRIEHPPPQALAMLNFIQTCSIMFRREWLPPLDEQFLELKLGDWPLCVLLSQRGPIGYIDRNMAHYRVHANNSWNNRPAEYKIRAMERMAWYLLERVEDDSKDIWRDTVLALAFKDLALAMKSMAVSKIMERFWRFAKYSMRFKKPFWVFNRLWPYYQAQLAAT